MTAINQTHYLPRPLPWGNGSRARWAVRPSGAVIVFVHGFGGDATGTWNDFGELLPSQKECAGLDLIFYGYDSLTKQAAISAAEFREFLNAVATTPTTQGLRDARGVAADFHYQRLVLVAHSLGAVVAREALIQAAGQPSMQTWVRLVRLAFFAPAHMGAKVTKLAEEAIGAVKFTWFGIAGSAFKAYAQVLSDLETGSPCLTRLERETRRLIAEGFDNLKAAVVVQGELDRIIDATPFCDDPGPHVEPDVGHTKVCKPSTGYMRPIEHLVAVLALP